MKRRNWLLLFVISAALMGCGGNPLTRISSWTQARIHCPSDSLIGPPQWSSDGTQVVYIASNTTNHLMIADAESGELVEVLASHTVISPRWSPDGTRLLVFSIEGSAKRLLLIDTESGEASALLEFMHPGGFGTYHWSPDGQHIAFNLYGQSGISSLHVIEVDSGSTIEIAADYFSASWSAWSSDSTRIAFLAANNGMADIVIATSDGSDAQTLLTRQSVASELMWSPDSDQIAFVSSDAGGNNSLVVVDAGNGAAITLAGDIQMPVAWTADGTALLYLTQADQIAKIQADGSSMEIVLEGVIGAAYTGAFSPDASQLAYISNRSGLPELYVIDLSDGTEDRLTSNPGHKLCFK